MPFTRKDLDRAADELVRSLLAAESFETRKYTFRGSSLPFCQLRYVWDTLAQEQGKVSPLKRTFVGDFYMEVGTAIHTVVQRWLGRSGFLFGHWKCPKCYETTEPLLGEQSCVECGVKCVYEEFQLRHESGFTGHCDGLIRLPGTDLADDEFDLLEIKTTSDAKVDSITAKRGIRTEYHLQVAAYVTLLRQMGYKIKRVLFLYVPRNNPRNIKPVWWNKAGRASTMFTSEVTEYLNAKSALVTEDYSELTGICQTNDTDCVYSVFCFAHKPSDMFTEQYERSRETKPKSLPIFPGDLK